MKKGKEKKELKKTEERETEVSPPAPAAPGLLIRDPKQDRIAAGIQRPD